MRYDAKKALNSLLLLFNFESRILFVGIVVNYFLSVHEFTNGSIHLSLSLLVDHRVLAHHGFAHRHANGEA